MLRDVKTRFRPVHSTQHALVYLGGTAHSARCTRNEVIKVSRPAKHNRNRRKGGTAGSGVCTPTKHGNLGGFDLYWTHLQAWVKTIGGKPRTNPPSTYIPNRTPTNNPKPPFIHVRRSEFGFEPKHRPSPLGCRSSLGVIHKEGRTKIITTISPVHNDVFTNRKHSRCTNLTGRGCTLTKRHTPDLTR